MLYQLSYASPSCPKDAQPTPENQESVPEFSADTLPLRTFNGTENKVSIPLLWEQTRTGTWQT